MTLLTREEFDTPASLGKTQVRVLWKGQIRTVFVHEMSVAERTRFDKSVVALGDQVSEGEDANDFMREVLLIHTAGDEHGNRLFTFDDLPLVSGLGSGFAEPIVNAAMSLNRIGENDLEELAKNFEATSDASS